MQRQLVIIMKAKNPLELAERKGSVGVYNEHHTDDDVGIVYLGQNGH